MLIFHLVEYCSPSISLYPTRQDHQTVLVCVFFCFTVAARCGRTDLLHATVEISLSSQISDMVMSLLSTYYVYRLLIFMVIPGNALFANCRSVSWPLIGYIFKV